MFPVTDINSRQGRYPGQVPIDRQAVKMLEEKPKDWDINRYFEHPVLTAKSVIDGLGFDIATMSQWVTYINKAVTGKQNELDFRKEIMVKAIAEGLEPIVRNIIGTRAIQYYKAIKKSIQFHIDLEKAEARGGNYFRRVPKKNGKGYNYFYNEDDYHKNKNSHLDGDTAHRGYIGNKIKVMLSTGAKDIKAFKGLVKKYGVDKVHKVIQGSIEKGDLVYKGKKFVWKGSNKDE